MPRNAHNINNVGFWHDPSFLWIPTISFIYVILRRNLIWRVYVTRLRTWLMKMTVGSFPHPLNRDMIGRPALPLVLLSIGTPLSMPLLTTIAMRAPTTPCTRWDTVWTVVGRVMNSPLAQVALHTREYTFLISSKDSFQTVVGLILHKFAEKKYPRSCTEHGPSPDA